MKRGKTIFRQEAKQTEQGIRVSPCPCSTPRHKQQGCDVALTLQAQLTGAAGCQQKVGSNSRAPCRLLLTKHSNNRLQRGAPSPPDPAPPAAVSQLRSGPHTPSVLLSYQQELPSTHSQFPESQQQLTPLPQPLALLPIFPSTSSEQGLCPMHSPSSPDMGTSQRATPVLIWRPRCSLQGAATAPLAERGTLQHHRKDHTELDVEKELMSPMDFL